MFITTKGKNALTGMIDLIKNSNGKPVRLIDISQRNNLSLNYLEQIFRKLRIAGIVKAIKGPKGGYVLNDDTKTIKDVFQAVNEDIFKPLDNQILKKAQDSFLKELNIKLIEVKNENSIN